MLYMRLALYTMTIDGPSPSLRRLKHRLRSLFFFFASTITRHVAVRGSIKQHGLNKGNYKDGNCVRPHRASASRERIARTQCANASRRSQHSKLAGLRLLPQPSQTSLHRARTALPARRRSGRLKLAGLCLFSRSHPAGRRNWGRRRARRGDGQRRWQQEICLAGGYICIWLYMYIGIMSIWAIKCHLGHTTT